MTDEQLRILADLVVKLTELRLQDCRHLCIENYAPELLAKLVYAVQYPRAA